MTNLVFKTLTIYFALLLTMRLLGKRQLGEMELSEFVVAALMADIAAIPLQDTELPLYRGLLPVFVLLCCELLIAKLSLKSVRLRALLFGKPSPLIVKGKIMQDELRRNRYTCDELMQELRARSITDPTTVEYAILETNGTLSVLPYPAQQPANAAMLGLDPGEGGYPLIIICDGRRLDNNLSALGLDAGWLKKELKRQGIGGEKDVFLMTADRSGKVYVAKRE